MTTCFYCIHPATTTDKRGNPACQYCRMHVAPSIPDAIVTDLERVRHGEHKPMSEVAAEQARKGLGDLTGHPIVALNRLLAGLRGQS